MLTSEVFSVGGMFVLLNVLVPEGYDKCSRCLPCSIALGSEPIRLLLVAQNDFINVYDDLQRRVSNETMEKCWRFVKCRERSFGARRKHEIEVYLYIFSQVTTWRISSEHASEKGTSENPVILVFTLRFLSFQVMEIWLYLTQSVATFLIFYCASVFHGWSRQLYGTMTRLL